MSEIGSRSIKDLRGEIAALRAELVEARSADKVHQDLLVTAAHELRSPLNALGLHLAHLEQLSLRAKDSDLTAEIKRTERILHGYGDKVRALMDVARISAGVFTLNLERVVLAQVVAEIIELYRAKAEYQRVNIRSRLEAGLAGEWDRVAVETILSNLVSNALNHADGADVAIETASDGLGNAIVRVADRGPGIEEDQRSRIFEKFSRAAGAESTIGGFGLGLWIARELASLHGGTITVDPTACAGATFVVTLPTAPASAFARLD
jgi:signal transduction histidine kinase